MHILWKLRSAAIHRCYVKPIIGGKLTDFKLTSDELQRPLSFAVWIICMMHLCIESKATYYIISDNLFSWLGLADLYFTIIWLKEKTNFFFIHGSSCEDYQQTCYNLAAIGDPVHANLLLASIRADFPEQQGILLFRQHHRYQYFINPYFIYQCSYVKLDKRANR